MSARGLWILVGVAVVVFVLAFILGGLSRAWG